jgi:hypothetical protein
MNLADWQFRYYYISNKINKQEKNKPMFTLYRFCTQKKKEKENLLAKLAYLPHFQFLQPP